MSCTSDDSEHHRNVSDLGSRVAPAEERIEPNVTESYKGEWKNDKRSGYGICERTDGLKYAGEWLNNKKHGYGITYFKDGTKEEGRYKNNVLVCSTRRKGLMFVRSSKLRERIEASVEAARRAAEMAAARVDIAESRTMTANERSDMALEVSARAQDDADTARIHAAQFDPGFRQPGIEIQRQSRNRVLHNHAYANHVSFESTTSAFQHPHSRGVTPVAQQHYVEPSQQYLASQRVQPHQHAQFYQPQPTPNRIAEPHHQLDTAPGPSHAYDGAAMENAAMAQQYNVAGQYGYQQPMEAHAQSNRASASEHSLHSTAPGSSYQIAEGGPVNPQFYQQPAVQQSTANEPQMPNKAHLMPDGRLMGNSVGLGSSRQQLPSTSAADAEYGAPPRLSNILRNNPEGSSMMSLSDDHFDQYVINRPNAEARLRRNRPSLTRQSEVVGDATNLNRRSTLASSRDRQAAGGAADFLRKEHREGDRGSLPNLDELEEHGVHLRREDAARLASQRRQEEQRLREEEELLRANPLRYLYHPTLRNWLYTWKVPLILVAANLCLLYILIELLVHKSDHNPAGPERHG